MHERGFLHVLKGPAGGGGVGTRGLGFVLEVYGLGMCVQGGSGPQSDMNESGIKRRLGA